MARPEGGLTDEPGPPLSEAIPACLKHHEHRGSGTIEAKRNVLKKFADIIGANKPVTSIMKADSVTASRMWPDVNETVYLRLPLKTLSVNLEKLRYKL